METFQDELERDEEEEEKEELAASVSEDESLQNRNNTESFEKTSDKQGRKRGKPSGVSTPTKISKYDQEAKVQITLIPVL